MRIKRPPGAKKKPQTQTKHVTPLQKAMQKLRSIWLEPRNVNVTEDVIKSLDEIAAMNYIKSAFDLSYWKLLIISQELLRVYLGNKWVDKYVTEEEPNKSLRKFGKLIEFKSEKFLDRLTTLAETLYNLQGIEGIENKIHLLKKEDVESALAELEGIQLLFAARKKLKIVIPSGVKRVDYDVEAYLSDGTAVACEMKCKFESTELSKNTIKRSITDGAEQLPKDKCGAVFVKLPETWKISSSLNEQIATGVDDAFRHTKTVSVVVLHWESWDKLDSGGSVKRMNYDVKLNQNAHLTHADLSQIVKPITGTYRRFLDIVSIPNVNFKPANDD